MYNTASTLTWSSTDATSCTAGGAWSGSKGTSGSYSTGNLTTSQTYTLYCTGPAGNSTTQTVTVSIIPIPVITSFTASPNPVAYNTGSTLTWSSTGATSCTATGAWSGVKASSGSYPTGNLTTPKTYTLTCTGPGGTSAPQTVTVNVNPPPTPVITSFTASPNPVAYNTASTLTWSSTDAASCTASSDWSGVKAVSGNQSTGNLTTPKTYTLTCTGPGGTSAPQSVTVTVLAPLPDLTPLSFTATVPSTGGTFFNGENIVLSGSMKNNGFLATVSAFDNNFSYRWNGTGFWTNITPYTNHPAGFAVGATAVDNATLNPSGSGQLNIQYCVDSSNSIPENNPTIGETNNCIVTDFTVHPKPTGNLTITSPVAYNTSSNISWTTNNPDPAACIPRVTGTGGPWSGLSGTKVSPLLTSDTLYSLTCAPYPGVLDSKLVDVNTDVFIKASPRLVNKGQTSTVTWGTGMEANCSIIANSVTVVPSTTGLGSRTDTISANTTYTIDCPNVDQTVKVEVQGYGQES